MQTAESATNASEALKKVTARARERVRGEGERLIEEAKEEAQGFAVERRDVAASYVGDLAAALDSATETLEARGRTGSAHYVRMAASELHRLGDKVNRQDVGRFVGEVEGFARQQPLLFFGGAFLIGYAAIRLMGSGSGGGEYDVAGDADVIDATASAPELQDVPLPASSAEI